MGDEVASSNVNRSYSLAATSIAIFTFMLFFLYPRFKGGEINAWLFQVLLVVMGVATFSFVFASFYYLRRLARQPDRRWPAGTTTTIVAAIATPVVCRKLRRFVPLCRSVDVGFPGMTVACKADSSSRVRSLVRAAGSPAP